ncbi:MAG: hypothetical protein NTX71_06000 [Candidatus Aureabacteria bacterium]|nr:hypothetical protein [Candidatus Auribacterota bacterium]
MEIAIIGWGSLVWDPRDLPREGTWQEGGPRLSIEFSRISCDARLTLVIDKSNGNVVPTMHVLSPRASLDDARDDLKKREGTSDEKIGWVDITRGTSSPDTNPRQTDVHDVIRTWCQEHGYQAAVWTALDSNFKKETEREFSVEAAIAYLSGLPMNVRKKALKYIWNAPEFITTKVREAVKQRFGEQGA